MALASSDIATKTGADPYTIQMFMNSGGSWGSYLYLGGPTAYAPPKATFNQITFNIETGGDDLRGDSSATASVVLPGGTQTFTLKAQSDPGWPNNSDHVQDVHYRRCSPATLGFWRYHDHPDLAQFVDRDRRQLERPECQYHRERVKRVGLFVQSWRQSAGAAHRKRAERDAETRHRLLKTDHRFTRTRRRSG